MMCPQGLYVPFHVPRRESPGLLEETLGAKVIDDLQRFLQKD
jgi:hypothetical protein